MQRIPCKSFELGRLIGLISGRIKNPKRNDLVFNMMIKNTVWFNQRLRSIWVDFNVHFFLGFRHYLFISFVRANSLSRNDNRIAVLRRQYRCIRLFSCFDVHTRTNRNKISLTCCTYRAVCWCWVWLWWARWPLSVQRWSAGVATSTTAME